MFPRVPFSFKITLGIDRTDLSALIFHSLRVGRKRECKREKKGGRERGKERERTERERERERKRKTEELYFGYLIDTNFSTTRKVTECWNQGKSPADITHPARP